MSSEKEPNTEQSGTGAGQPETGAEHDVEPVATQSGEQNPIGEVASGAASDEASEIPEEADELVAALLEARHQVESHWETVLRTQADMENLRKRVQRDVENAHKYGLERFLEELLPIRDSMELGLAATHEEGVSLEQVREGVELTLKMLTGAMEKFGVEVVDPVESPFNPEFHQAMSMQDVPGVESGTVTMVMQKGFVLNGRLVRPALVMVAK